ncbi:MAG: DUF2628 domain-containing protein [Eubacterium sp.]|nr:DUF2628 domain-containing protein [Eubacterium sp.]
MLLPKNAFCPVCNKEFEPGDDIVFCPECGTPHHRECYNAVGHCVNRGLHESGYSYNDDMKKVENKEEDKKETPDDFSSIFQNLKKDNNEESEFSNPIILPSVPQYESAYEKDEQKIDGESVADFAVTIRNNIPRFIKIFKEFEYAGRKTSWNWGAFFFGSLYLFFRKMYKHAFAFMCAFVGVVWASCFAMTKLAPNYVESMKSFAELYSQNKITQQDIEALTKISDMSKASLIIDITFVVILVIRIVLALFADKFYKSTISEFIKSVNEQLKDGASFIQAPMFPSQNTEMTQQQMKRYYLSRRGGTSLFMPIMAAFAIYFLISLAYSTLFF